MRKVDFKYIYTTTEYIFREVGIIGGYKFETKLYTTTNTKAQGGAVKNDTQQ